jgi:hypothetical protein
MAAIAVSLLWLLIGAIVLAGVIWLVIYGINNFITPIPERLVQGIWFIFLLLIIIYAITAFMSGGVSHPFRWGAVPGGPLAAIPFAAAHYL